MAIAAKKLCGWKRDKEDKRDYMLPVVEKAMVAAPPEFEFVKDTPRLYDQKNLGSCTAHAFGGQVKTGEILALAGGEILADVILEEDPAFLQVYWCTRKIAGNEGVDSGASLRDTIKAGAKYGYTYASLYPYVTRDFKKVPSAKVLADAKKRTIDSYHRVPQTAENFKDMICKKKPIIFGFDVFSGLMNVQADGIMAMPKRGEKAVGGHAVMIVGYSDKILKKQDAYLIRNSWGAKWGKNGHFWMPAKFILDPEFAADFWVVDAL